MILFSAPSREKGLEYDALEAMLALDVEMRLVLELQDTSIESGLLPFMLAASLSECKLDVVYKLAAMTCPDLLYN